VILDLDYAEDSQAETDMNVIMTEQSGILEVQATAEKNAFSKLQLDEMLSIAEKGINQLFKKQREVLSIK
jgi:ribonuclease PH